jgi:hypothetical protein
LSTIRRLPRPYSAHDSRGRPQRPVRLAAPAGPRHRDGRAAGRPALRPMPAAHVPRADAPPRPRIRRRVSRAQSRHVQHPGRRPGRQRRTVWPHQAPCPRAAAHHDPRHRSTAAGSAVASLVVDREVESRHPRSPWQKLSRGPGVALPVTPRCGGKKILGGTSRARAAGVAATASTIRRFSTSDNR